MRGVQGPNTWLKKSVPVHFVGFKSFFLLRFKVCETFKQIVFMDKVSRLQSTIKKGSVCSNFGGYYGRKAAVLRFALSQSFKAPGAKLWRFGMYVFLCTIVPWTQTIMDLCRARGIPFILHVIVLSTFCPRLLATALHRYFSGGDD